MSSIYPVGSVRALLATDHVTAATSGALQARLAAAPYQPRFLDPAAYALLEAVAARLLPQPERAVPIALAPALDQRLAENRGDGWRYDALPADGEALRRGLTDVEASAQAQFQRGFRDLAAAEQDAVLRAVQTGQSAAAGQPLPTQRFFEDLLAELTELYYCHPLAQEEIGYVGMADLPGWTRIGLYERENREPVVSKT